MNPGGKKELTREELYEKVWSTPTVQVAAELGISDVALAKRCKKLNVPKPSLGYWAKVAAGQKPEKVPLPPGPEPIKYEPLDAAVANKLPLPEDNQDLHPVAAELQVTLRGATLDSNQYVKVVDERTVPPVTVSKPLIDRTAKALHVLLTAVEARGIAFVKSRSKYDAARFEKGQSRLYFFVEEVLVPREPTAKEKRHYDWQWQKFGSPSGKLAFTINPERKVARSEKKWAETDKLSIEEVLSRVVQGICKHYADLERQHAEAMERHRKQYEAYEIQQQAEHKRQHTATLEATAHTRSEDLFKAAEWWRLHQVTMDFINECEQLWRRNSPGELSAEQQGWLGWARENAKSMSPFETDYPDPAKDGVFDPATVPFGGPYPAKRDFPRPPTMPKIPPPVQSSGYTAGHVPVPKQQFPFWLKYQGR